MQMNSHSVIMPSIPIPTDNIYKFSCLFGLVLIVTSIIAFESSYSSSLDRKVKLLEASIAIKAKSELSKSDAEQLALNDKLISVTKENEEIANNILSTAFALGIIVSFIGGVGWWTKIQKRDDRLSELQIKKVEAEIDKLKSETRKELAIGGAGHP